MTTVSMEIANKQQLADVFLEVEPVTREVPGGDIIETLPGLDVSRRVG